MHAVTFTMNPRNRDKLLLIAGLPGIVAPWIPLFETGDSSSAVRFAFVDFLNMPALGYAQTWLERVVYIIGALPVFLPFPILHRQLGQLNGHASAESGAGRMAVLAAMGWVAFYAIVSLWNLPAQLVADWALTDQQEVLSSLVDEAIRVTGLFGSIGVGGWLLMRLLRKPAGAIRTDVAECAFMITYIVAILPELVTDALSAANPNADGRLLPGYGLLLWTCVAYGITLVLRLREARRPLLQ